MAAGQLPVAATSTSVTSSVPFGTSGNNTVILTSPAGDIHAAGALYAGGGTNPVLISTAPSANWYTFLYAPDGTGTSGRGIALGSSGAGGASYHTNDTHTFRNAAASTNYCSFQSGGTYNISGAWLVISDPALKENVVPYTRGLEAVRQLNPVTFSYKAGTMFATKAATRHIGLLADEVAPVIPEIVGEASFGEDNVQTLEPGTLIYALINAVKEITARLETLERAVP
jgi:hypothetical protein